MQPTGFRDQESDRHREMAPTKNSGLRWFGRSRTLQDPFRLHQVLPSLVLRSSCRRKRLLRHKEVLINLIPHQYALRKRRLSIPGAWYSITTCIDKRIPILVSDPLHPLAEPEPARIIEKSIRWLHHHSRWQCKGYVVMPDHVHIIFILGEADTLSEVMQSFGKNTSKHLNKLMGNSGRVWQKGYYDHYLRNEESYIKHLRYIQENPVRKGFTDKPEDWPFTVIEPQW